MSTLLLRFAAPLQAWGTESKYDIRKTDREPSKSGIVGFLAAALGRRRDESVEDLNALRVGVRVDQEGKIIQDFHMVHKDEKTSYLTRRYYLSDAIFVVGVEAQDEDIDILKELEYAVKNPVYPLFLGRRSCRVVQSYWEYVNVIWKRPLTQKCGKFQSGVEKKTKSLLSYEK